MPQPFEVLGETLLRAGVAPRHVRGYLRELSEHLRDLVGEELQAGKSPGEAQAAARARLGPDEALAGAMLAQPSLRSWTGRAPWATLVVAPFLLLVMAWLVPLLSPVLVFGPKIGLCVTPAPAWLAPATGAMLTLVQVGGPLLICAGAAFVAARQRSRVIWPFLGCLAVAYVGGATWGYLPSSSPRFCDTHLWFNWSRTLAEGSFGLAVAAAVYWMGLRRPRA